MSTPNNKKGFTLVEVMIVVVIIGLLAAIAVPSFQRVRDQAIRSIVKNNLRQISGGAIQHMLIKQVTSVNYASLEGEYFPTIESAAGEAYPTLINLSDDSLSVKITLSDGTTENIVYNM